MEILILKSNIENDNDFKKIRNELFNSFEIHECTIDLYDSDKVLRVVGEKLNIENVIGKIKDMGYSCEELNC